MARTATCPFLEWCRVLPHIAFSTFLDSKHALAHFGLDQENLPRFAQQMKQPAKNGCTPVSAITTLAA
jgi:hypothetical protein